MSACAKVGVGRCNAKVRSLMGPAVAVLHGAATLTARAWRRVVVHDSWMIGAAADPASTPLFSVLVVCGLEVCIGSRSPLDAPTASRLYLKICCWRCDGQGMRMQAVDKRWRRDDGRRNRRGVMWAAPVHCLLCMSPRGCVNTMQFRRSATSRPSLLAGGRSSAPPFVPRSPA